MNSRRRKTITVNTIVEREREIEREKRNGRKRSN